jgi:CheY-like chemotaxis protein
MLDCAATDLSYTSNQEMVEKILIVDDDIDSLKLIGLMLQRNGYEVVAANAGMQALTKAAAELPDLIILDVMMPDMNGYDVCRRLRADSKTQAIPIIMFTAKTLIDDKVAGFEAGADDYLTKPTHPAELASRVKAILARSAERKAREAPRGMTIGVLGSKGGVGTTTLALNLGAAMMQGGDNPVIADFRLGMGSMGLFLGMGRINGMANLLGKPPNEITPNVIESDLARHQSGLRILLSSTSPREAHLDYSIESALAIINGLRSVGKPAIFDLGSGFSPLISHLQQEMDQLILLVEPNRVSLETAKGLISELVQLGGSVLAVGILVE